MDDVLFVGQPSSYNGRPKEPSSRPSALNTRRTSLGLSPKKKVSIVDAPENNSIEKEYIMNLQQQIYFLGSFLKLALTSRA